MFNLSTCRLAAVKKVISANRRMPLACHKRLDLVAARATSSP
jgi:hypothetical protein